MPSLLVINEKLMTKEDYMKKLQDIAKDIAKSSHIKGTITGRAFYKGINNMSFIQHEIKYIFVVKPTFSWYTEVYEIYHNVTNIDILDEDQWDKLCEF